MIPTPRDVWSTAPITTSVLIVLLVAVLSGTTVTLTRKGVQAVRKRQSRRTGSGAGLFYVVATMSTAVSANTSWRFFGHQLGITATAERAAMFAVLEVAFIACAYAMRANVRTRLDGQPGAPRMVVWLLTVVASYMAITESGFWSGIARVALGPALGIVALHLALGIELRQSNGESTGTLGRIAHELRERGLSRLGLADDHRNALARTQDRAARRAARLAKADRVWFRERRLQRALEKSNVAHDATVRKRMLDELAMLQHAQALATLAQPSPWSRPDVSPQVAPTAATALPDQRLESPTTASTEPDHGRHMVGIEPTTPTTDPDQSTTAQAENPALQPTMTGAATDADHCSSVESDHGRTPHTTDDGDREDTQTLPVTVAAVTAISQVSAESGGSVRHVDHTRTTVPTQDTGSVVQTRSTSPASTESDHDDRKQPTTPGPRSGQLSHPTTPDPTTGTAATAVPHDEPDHVQDPDPTVGGRYGTRVPTRGLSHSDIARTLAPVATALQNEEDFLSREDVKAITEITSSQTANEVLALLRAGASDTGDGNDLPKPRGRRRERDRTIQLALGRITQQPHIKAVH